jgi:gluconolactonase
LFDSLAVDSGGCICVGSIPGNISVVSPDGENCEDIAMPDPFPTNICFGGPDLKTAYITLSGAGRLIAMDWARPGTPLHFLN